MALADVKKRSLISLGYAGAVSDMELAYYLANGAVTPNINDATAEFLVAAGATEANIADMWVEVLTAAPYSYTGDLTALLFAFWDGIYVEA